MQGEPKLDTYHVRTEQLHQVRGHARQDIAVGVDFRVADLQSKSRNSAH